MCHLAGPEDVSSLSDLVAAGKWGADQPRGDACLGLICISPHRVVIVDCYNAKVILLMEATAFDECE